MWDDRTSGSSLFDTKMTQPISIFILKKRKKNAIYRLQSTITGQYKRSHR